jgi:hypothetical protein
MCADPYNPTSLDARLHAPERVLSFDVQGDGRVGFVERQDILEREQARAQRMKKCLPDDVVMEDVCSSLTSMWDAIEAAEKKGERPELSEEERGLEAGMFDYHNHVDKYPEAPPSGKPATSHRLNLYMPPRACILMLYLMCLSSYEAYEARGPDICCSCGLWYDDRAHHAVPQGHCVCSALPRRPGAAPRYPLLRQGLGMSRFQRKRARMGRT